MYATCNNVAIMIMCCASTVRFVYVGLCKMYIHLRAHEAGVILRDQYAPEAFLVQDAHTYHTDQQILKHFD